MRHTPEPGESRKEHGTRVCGGFCCARPVVSELCVNQRPYVRDSDLLSGVCPRFVGAERRLSGRWSSLDAAGTPTTGFFFACGAQRECLPLGPRRMWHEAHTWPRGPDAPDAPAPPREGGERERARGPASCLLVTCGGCLWWCRASGGGGPAVARPGGTDFLRDGFLAASDRIRLTVRTFHRKALSSVRSDIVRSLLPEGGRCPIRCPARSGLDLHIGDGEGAHRKLYE